LSALSAVAAAALAAAGEPGAAPAPAPSTATAPLDVTAETVPDTAATVATALARRAELLVLARQSLLQEEEVKLDSMRDRFNAAQAKRAESLREMNVLRDMALEQAKKDDEVLKKYIAMI
jgi:ribosomal protein L16 Arg81 hydroxylase